MNEHQQYSKQWGADDFRRYYDGSMPQQEMNALEKAALDDPFLDDALQGYAYTKTPMEDIAALKQRLQQNDNKTRVLWYRQKPVILFSRVAAVLLLFAGITMVISRKNNTINKQAELATVAVPATVQQQYPSLKADSVKDIIAMLPKKQQAPELPAAIMETKDAAPLSIPIAAAPVTIMQVDKARAEAMQANDAKAKDVVTMASEDRRMSSELAGKVAGVNVSSIKQVTGRIVNDKGAPVANAIIINKQNNQNFTSDKEGNFSLNAPNNFANIKVDVNALGYQVNSGELDSTGSNVVVLKEMNEGLSEVIVTSAYEKKRTARNSMPAAASANNFAKTQLLKNIKITNASPYNGWDSLNNTAAASINKLRKLAPTGEAKITFDVDDKGAPANVVVQPNACTSCLNELINFMNQLPPLQKVKKNKKLILELKW